MSILLAIGGSVILLIAYRLVALLGKGNVGKDAGVVDLDNLDGFIVAAKTRQWDRERLVRTLA